MKSFFNRLAATVAGKTLSAQQEVKRSVVCLKSDERGLSGVVVAILLVLVAVLAVVMIWGFLGDYLQDLFDRITAADTL